MKQEYLIGHKFYYRVFSDIAHLTATAIRQRFCYPIGWPNIQLPWNWRRRLSAGSFSNMIGMKHSLLEGQIDVCNLGLVCFFHFVSTYTFSWFVLPRLRTRFGLYILIKYDNTCYTPISQLLVGSKTYKPKLHKVMRIIGCRDGTCFQPYFYIMPILWLLASLFLL